MKSINTWFRSMTQASLSLFFVFALVACGDNNSDPANNTSNESTSDNQHKQSAQTESAKQTSQLKQTGQSAMAANTTNTKANNATATIDDAAKNAKSELQTRNDQLQQTLIKTLKTHDPANASCASLAVKQCIASKACILSQDKDKAYHCRDAANHCESGFIQAGIDLEKSCTSKKGCAFSNASCFCPPGMTCICGGGKPAACLLNGTK